jgi:peptide/nickel transport system substrate-binding protein
MRRSKKQVEGLGVATEESFDKHLFRRLTRLPNIRRFLIGWIGLLVLLIVLVVVQTRSLGGHYKTLQPRGGGIFTEGIVGSFTNASPLFAASPVDSAVSKLIFAGLLKYDGHGQLVNDLAESWKLDKDEMVYTVTLRPNLTWQDGQPLTAGDVVFTYSTIQNPETKSYLLPSWRGIKIVAKDDRTITFTLPNKLSSFPHSLTNGIVPQHILADVDPSQLRSHSFNNVSPVGAGPFAFDTIEVSGEFSDLARQESIALKAFDKYYAGRPKLDSFIVRTFTAENGLVTSYGDKQVDAMAGLPSLPDQYQNDPAIVEYSLPLAGQVMVFFKTSEEVLADAAVRRGLTLATDKPQLIEGLPYTVPLIDEPLLRSHIGYSRAFRQTTNKFADAEKVLDAAGWKRDPASGVRAKDGKKLTFRMFSQNTREYTSVAGELQKQWRALGVDMQVELQPEKELQNTVAMHNYDALLYGINLGPDPDVFAFWHSTQADPRSDTRLNFSEYKSKVADQALEGGRTRSDTKLRAVKYRPFLETWRADAPAVALYQPRFLYVVRAPFHGIDAVRLNSATDRFSDVHNWTVRESLQ